MFKPYTDFGGTYIYTLGGSLRNLLTFLFIGVIIVSGVSAALFGTSILGNFHQQFLRYKAKNVVKIFNPKRGGGTGSFVRAKSGKVVILTNHHICQLAEDGKLDVSYFNGSATVKVIKSYLYNDLCTIEAPEGVNSGLSVARSVTKGEIIYSMGHPLLEPLTVSSGEYSASVTVDILDSINTPKSECNGPTYKFQEIDNPLLRMFGMFSVCVRILDATSSTMNILPGNSGSPVVNIYGNVVAVAFAANESGVHSYLVPLSDVKAFLEDN